MPKGFKSTVLDSIASSLKFHFALVLYIPNTSKILQQKRKNDMEADHGESRKKENS